MLRPYRPTRHRLPPQSPRTLSQSDNRLLATQMVWISGDPASPPPCPACVAAGLDEPARQARPMQERRGNEQRCCNVATGITEESFTSKETAAPHRGRDPCVPPLPQPGGFHESTAGGAPGRNPA